MKRSAVLLLGSAFGLALAASPPLRAKTELIYSLDTTCTIGQGKPQPCQVEALEVGDATEYRHRLGARTISYRILEDPYVRIEGRRASGDPWRSVRNAWINFGTNELCFNDRAFCVVNPTFLADVKADAEGPAFEERQTVGLAFGPSGRVDIACFDDGCRRLLEAIGR
ncbi:hypothetical protein [Vulcanococcus sp.]|jgi:hypothetical protein|uniref:hypothetical protein n=1 Tax=Vulcanococcus sp. TaxID=2856995 RepID=UPI0025D09DC5|nr:hypothetical protein [Vulcanococcus sp.]